MTALWSHWLSTLQDTFTCDEEIVFDCTGDIGLVTIPVTTDHSNNDDKNKHDDDDAKTDNCDAKNVKTTTNDPTNNDAIEAETTTTTNPMLFRATPSAAAAKDEPTTTISLNLQQPTTLLFFCQPTLALHPFPPDLIQFWHLLLRLTDDPVSFFVGFVRLRKPPDPDPFMKRLGQLSH